MPQHRKTRRPGSEGKQAGSPLNVVVWGRGEPVVCVHGSLSWGTFAFREQRPLASSHSLVLPDRRGYGASPVRGPSDFSVDADDIAALLGDGAHLVGHSYGAVVALLAAARRPDAVRTLTAVEPAALSAARGDAAVEELIATLGDVHTAASSLSPAEFVLRFHRGLRLPARRGHARAPQAEPRGDPRSHDDDDRAPTLGSGDPSRCAGDRAGCPTLIVSGRWDNLAAGEQALGRRAFGAVCDTLTRSLDARRVIIDGWAHGCQYSGEPFNSALLSFWESSVATAWA